MALQSLNMRINLSSVVTHYGLIGARIHRLFRSGLTWTPVAGEPVPGSLEFKFESAAGKITFGTPGPMAGGGGAFIYESIRIIYET
jgi:hypothetical protein